MLTRPLLRRFAWGLSSAATSNLAFLNFRKTFFWKPQSYFSRVDRPMAAIHSTKNKFQEVKSFDELTLPSRLKEQLVKLYPATTEIQQKTMGVILSGADLIGVAKTGSGKTLAYGLPTIMRVKEECLPKKQIKQGPSYLILSPTRELAAQIENHLKWICTALDLKIQTVCGGDDRFGQLMRLRNGCDVMVATPGRLLDFLNDGKFTLDGVKYLTLDEADRILEVGYEQQIIEIAKRLPKDRQTTLFTATWQKKVQKVFSEYMNNNPQYVQIGDGEVSFNLDIKQSFEICSGREDKMKSMSAILSGSPDKKTLIFTNMKVTAEELSHHLEREGYKVSLLSGDLRQNQRTFNLNQFRSGRTKVLIATDVASRGLDIDDVSCVINFDFPQCVKTYIHRIGRTGRAGKSGKSVAYLDSQVSSEATRELLDLHKKHELEKPKELLEFLTIVGNSFQGNQRQSRHRNRSSSPRHSGDQDTQNRRPHFNRREHQGDQGESGADTFSHRPYHRQGEPRHSFERRQRSDDRNRFGGARQDRYQGKPVFSRSGFNSSKNNSDPNDE